MAEPSAGISKPRAFVIAKIGASRLVSEEVTSSPGQISKEQKQIQVRAETSSQFTVGLDDPVKPAGFQIEVDYKVILKDGNSEKQLVAYQAKYAAQFDVVEWTGFEDWTQVSQDALSPYFAIVHHIAVGRAEGTLVAMGVRGIALPRPEHFGQHTQLPSQKPLQITS